MKLSHAAYGPLDEIPVLKYLGNRKLVKYLNRETMAAIAAAGMLNDTHPLDPEIPCYYATGILEFEDYGLAGIAAGSRDAEGLFSHRRFIEHGIRGVSPLNQFKVLQNMPLSFVSINFGLRGDNAVVYSSAGSLLLQALAFPGAGEILIGAGKTRRDGSAEAGFAIVGKKEIEDSTWLGSDEEAVVMFRQWSGVVAP